MNKPIKETEHLHIIFKLIIAGMVSVLVIVVSCRLAFLGPFAYVWLFTPKNIHKEVSIQQAGEMLTVRYTTTYAREHSTDVYIFSEKQSDELTHYLVDGDYISPKIKQIYNTQKLVNADLNLQVFAS